MTTQVIIVSPKPNHQNILVKRTYAGEVADRPTLLEDGQSTVEYVYDGMTLIISEVPKG
jgi:hypothetical protein